MKDRKGYIVERAGKLYVRVQYTDSLGKRRELRRRAKDRTHARQLQKQLVKELDAAQEGNQHAELDGAKLTFRQLAERYEAVRLIPAQYVGDRKVAGLRSLRTPKAYLKRLVEHFGSARIRSITYSQIDQYRLSRLAEGLTIAAVNRELALLRSVFNFAKQEFVITRTPFEMGAPLIRAVDEAKRDRVLSRDEEERLLLALSDNYAHLLPLVVASLDTGARRGELVSLRWSDVDIEGGSILLRSVNTKTAKSRELPISNRLRDELQRIRTAAQRGTERSEDIASESRQGEDSAEALVFSTRNWRRAFNAALRRAGIDDFRWHDMRGTFCTRLIESGMPIEQVAKLSGHTELETLYKHYLSTTPETLQKATDILNTLNTLRNGEDGEAAPDYIN